MKRRLNDKKLSQFYSDLARLLESGISIDRGLHTMKEGKKDSIFWMIDSLQDHVGRGGTLWEGMTQHPRYFDQFQIMIIKGAEESGKIVETSKKLARYFENRYRSKQRFLAGLIYPIVLLHAVILLPPLKYLVVSSLNRSYLAVVIPPLMIGYGCALGIYLFWTKLCRTGPLKQTVDETILRLPVIGKLARDISLARAFWSLSAMISAGMEAVGAAKNAAAAAGNIIISKRLTGALYVLESGRSFKEYFIVSGMLTAEQLGIVAVGEEAGALAESLEKMVQLMEESNTHRFNMVMKGTGFFIYLVAVAIVVMTVISFYINHFNF